jgi:HEAT repeat protein/beta-lactamase regulating signal transducer with metallopeptidase domain
MTTAEWMTTASQMGPAAASWLLTYAVHSSLLLGGVGLATRYVVQSHTIRETLWKTALLGGLVTTSLQVGLGVVPLGGARALAAASDATPVRPALEPSTFEPHTPNRSEGTKDVRKNVTPPQNDAAVPSVSAPPPSGTTAPARSVGWTGALLLFWGGSAALLLLYFFLVRLRLVFRLGRRDPVEEGSLPRLLDSLRRQAGIRRPIRLTTSAGLTSPVALGLSEICIPEAVLTELDGEQQQSMLAHELAHLARLDPLWLTVSCLLEQLLFFQPLNRVARRRMQDAAEYLCDDWAVRRTGSGMTLAKCLVKVAEWVDTSPRTVPVSGMAEHRSQLVARIHRLLENRAMTTQPRTRWLLPLAVIALAAVAVVAPGFTAAHPAELDAQEPTPPRAAPARPHPVPEPMPVGMPSAAALRTAEANAMLAARTASMASVLNNVNVRMASRIAHLAGGRVQDTTNVAVPALIAALSDPDANVRMAAANSLGQLEDPRAIPALIAASRDSNAQVRSAAFDALTNFEDPRVVEPMIAALKDPDADVRQRAAQTLGSLQDKRALQPLMAALADSSADVRQAAAQSLGELQDPAAAGALAGALKDPKADVRQAAAQSLGEFELRVAPPALIAALKDADPDVRQAAAQSLGEIQDPAAVPALQSSLGDANADVREGAVRALIEISDSTAISALISALKSSDAGVRRQAAQALGQRQ